MVAVVLCILLLCDIIAKLCCVELKLVIWQLNPLHVEVGSVQDLPGLELALEEFDVIDQFLIFILVDALLPVDFVIHHLDPGPEIVDDLVVLFDFNQELLLIRVEPLVNLLLLNEQRLVQFVISLLPDLIFSQHVLSPEQQLLVLL